EQVALAVGRDPVVRLGPLEALAGAAPRLHEVALGIELEDRRRGNAALGRRRILRRVDFLRLERAGAAMNDVDVIVLVDADADDVAEDPVIGHRLGPHRIDFEARRLGAAFRLSLGRSLQNALTDGEHGQQREHARSDRDVTGSLHMSPPSGTRKYTTGWC